MGRDVEGKSDGEGCGGMGRERVMGRDVEGKSDGEGCGGNE